MTRLRWGLIGCGDIARKRVAPALRDSPACELVAVNRAQSALAESFARTFGARRWYADWQELLADADIDAVYIATPVHLHAPQTLAAAEAGKHVLCEKPMALDPGECARMIDVCRANRVRLAVAYYRHFYPAIARIKALIASGAIGDPVVAQINAFERFNPPPDHPRHWLVEKARAGGGPMFDFGCHRLEVLLHVLGPVRRLTSLAANVAFDREVEDTAVATLQFESGACATLTVTHAAQEPQDTLDIFGTGGSLHVAELNAGRIRIVGGGEERVEVHAPDANLHRPLIDDFVDAVLNDRDPAVSGETGKTVADLEQRIYGPRD
ncbi:MAG: gfo/Idh/MocA family oxidoreductase [Acidobacteria bacterium]|nr:MAG: gfo/Idh/MocA family oxidoreductase [Acidobacteriota bacterium]